MIERLFPELAARLNNISAETFIHLLLQLAPGALLGLGTAFIIFFLRDTLSSFLTRYLGQDHTYQAVARWAAHTIKAVGGWFIVISGIYIAIQTMPFMEKIDHPAQKLYTLFIFVQLGLIISHLIARWVEEYNAIHRKTDAARVTMVNTLVRVAYLIIWVLVLILLLDNYGVDVTAMVAGLGVGGLAVAFAFQNILKDIFGSFSIVFDKPFVIGDFISADAYSGTVEDIGTKTTRLRSPDGELIVISNNDILGARLRNYGSMSERRVLFHLRVQFGTPAAKLEKIPAMIQKMVESHPDTRFDRSHIQIFTDFGIQFETVYFLTHPDYMLMMNTQQAVLLSLYKQFEKEGILFAVPIQNQVSTPAHGTWEVLANEPKPRKKS